MINFSLNTCWRLIPTQRIAKTLRNQRISDFCFRIFPQFSRNFTVAGEALMTADYDAFP